MADAARLEGSELATHEDELRAEVRALESDRALAATFVAESRDLLGRAEVALVAFEQSAHDREPLNDAFRTFHTIKGNAAALGLVSVRTVAHKVEDLLDAWRSQRLPVEADAIALVQRSVGLLATTIDDLSARAAGNPGRSLHGERAWLLAALDGAIAGRLDTIVPVSSTPTSARVGASAGASVAASSASTVFFSARSSISTHEAATGSSLAMSTRIGVERRKLDHLVDTIGQLAQLQLSVAEHVGQTSVRRGNVARRLAELQRKTCDLGRQAASLSLVSLRPTFQRLRRLTHDLARASGKVVRFSASGDDIEVDGAVVDAIGAPLVHMVRNSIDHGLEDAALRASRGKPAVGCVSLSATERNGILVIDVADDGAGLDRARIVEQAVTQGLVDGSRQLAPGEVDHLIFAPGLSTAERVTAVSGRGVGMDVVKRQVEALGGRIGIDSRPGAGTTFTISIPLGSIAVAGASRETAPASRRLRRPANLQRRSRAPAPSRIV